MRRFGSLIAGLVILAVASPAALSSGLQERIDAAAPGETVVVEPGYYRENLKLREGVALVGSGAGATVIESAGSGPVILGAENAIVKGLTIIGGTEGVKTNGAYMGIFENVIRDAAGSAISSGGGDSVIVNNVIAGSRGKAGIEIARSRALVANNTLVDNQTALSYWQVSGGKAVNNIIAHNRLGIDRQEDSEPVFDNNCFRDNPRETEPYFSPEGSIYLDPLFVDFAAGDLALSDHSPLRALGVPVEGLPEELTAGVGADLGVEVPVADWRRFMEEARGETEAEAVEVLEYELLERLGYFLVTTRFPRPKFKVGSSTPATPIEEVSAWDVEEDEDLFSTVLGEEPPAVEVWGWETREYPVVSERYIMQSVFFQPDSFFDDHEGNLYFVRDTNFPIITIRIPEGFEIAGLSPEGDYDEEERLISISNPGRARLTVDLKLSPAVTE